MSRGVFSKGSKAGHIERRDERYQTEGLRCPAGKVVDLSSSGMRVRSESRPKVRRGDQQSFTLSTGTHRLTVQGCVAWVRRRSLFGRQYDIGVRFINLSPSLRTVLKNLAQYGFLGRLGHDSNGSSAPPPPPPPPSSVVSAEIELEDYYATLGVPRDAPIAQIRAAFRRLATQHHPDAGGDAQMFVRLNKAWSVLKDANERLRYDQMMQQARKSA